MTKIKICGLSRTLDIEYVNKLLPDYVGFVFAKSKRQVSVEQAGMLIKDLHESIKTVGVFVNEDIEKALSIAEKLNLKVLQFHGKEDKQYVESFKVYKVWKALGINSGPEGDELTQEVEDNNIKLNAVSQFSIEGILLDSSVKGVTGGTGVAFNWEILKDLKTNKSLILAGGLSPENIEEAIYKVKPFAVDVSGGVEVNGVKNYEKIKDFIDKVRKKI